VRQNSFGLAAAGAIAKRANADTATADAVISFEKDFIFFLSVNQQVSTDPIANPCRLLQAYGAAF
jgi:hypothetical protein